MLNINKNTNFWCRLIIEQLKDEKPRLMQEKDAEIDRLDRQKTKLENDLMNLKVIL